MIDIGSGGDLDVVIPLREGAPARQDLSPHADLLEGMAGIAVAAKNSVGGVSINHFRDVDHQGIFAGFARYSLHLGESVSQVAFRVAVHVFVKVVGSEVTQRALLSPARDQRAIGHLRSRGKWCCHHGANKQQECEAKICKGVFMVETEEGCLHGDAEAPKVSGTRCQGLTGT